MFVLNTPLHGIPEIVSKSLSLTRLSWRMIERANLASNINMSRGFAVEFPNSVGEHD